MANIVVDVCGVLCALFLPSWCLLDYISMAHHDAPKARKIKKQLKHEANQ